MLILGVSLLMLLGSCSAIRRGAGGGNAKSPDREVITEKKRDKEIEKEVTKHVHGEVKRVLEEAFTWVGTPYLYGGNDKNGADCSGFVMMVFDTSLGYKLPRVSAKQGDFCREVESSEVRAGDLVFFATGKNPAKISHVGLMIDQTRFLHASSTRGVCVSSMESNYYKKHFIKYGRLPCFEHKK